MTLTQKLTQATAWISERIETKPRCMIILGSGHDKIAEAVEVEKKFSFYDVPHVEESTVEHMEGVFLFGTMAGQPIMMMKGRFHQYEGFDPASIVFPIRLAKKLGVETLITTNSSGGLNPRLNAGDIMMITDHINLTGMSPLTGENDPQIGPRYPSMHAPYDKELQELVRRTALKCNVYLREGVYAGIHGPETETPAEARMILGFGADAVGMSTVLETIAAVHAGMKVIGLSVITDTPGNGEPLTPGAARKAARKAENDVIKLIKKVMEKLCAKGISNR